MDKLLKEPLIHFLLIGALLFLLYNWLNPEESLSQNRILVTQSDVDRLVKTYERNWNIRPDTATLRKLVDEHIRGEIFYQEALTMQLEHNDEIIKRRLRQKYEFLVKDLSEQRTPTEKELQEFYQKHQDNYQDPQKISFSHAYFSPDKRQNPRKAAERLWKKVKSKSEDELKAYGDDFHLQRYYAGKDYGEIAQNYGKTFADTLFSKSTTGWHTPMQSGYGYHVVHISDIQAPQPISFEKARIQVTQDWKQDQLKLLNEAVYEGLAKKYEVVQEHGYY